MAVAALVLLLFVLLLMLCQENRGVEDEKADLDEGDELGPDEVLGLSAMTIVAVVYCFTALAPSYASMSNETGGSVGPTMCSSWRRRSVDKDGRRCGNGIWCGGGVSAPDPTLARRASGQPERPGCAARPVSTQQMDGYMEAT